MKLCSFITKTLVITHINVRKFLKNEGKLYAAWFRKEIVRLKNINLH
jgi:hypothetical protein